MMIRKLAEELAYNTLVDHRTADVPAVKEDVTPKSPDIGIPPLSAKGHVETMHGTLGATFTKYRESADNYATVLEDVLGEKVRQISGSSAASQALGRHRNRKTGSRG